MKRQGLVVAAVVFSIAFLPQGIVLAQTPPPQEFVLEFSGGNIARAPDVQEFNLGSQFTMEGWVFITRVNPPNDLAPFQVIMGKVRDPFFVLPHVSFVISLSQEGKLEFVQSMGVGDTGRLATASAPAPLRTWIHVAATLGGGTMRLFVNGQQVATETSPGSPENTVAFALGAGDPGTDNPCCFSSIALREVRVWNRALSAGEIMAMMGLTLTGTEPGLVAYWPLDDGSGQTPRDLGPNNLDLELGMDSEPEFGDPRWVHTTTLDQGPFFVLEGPVVDPITSQNNIIFAGNPTILIDFDFDGDLDIVEPVVRVQDFEPTPLRAYRNDGQGNFTEDSAAAFGNQTIETSAVREIAVADFNGDGLLDLFFADQWEREFPGGPDKLLIGTPSGGFVDESATRIPLQNLFTHSAPAGDIDGDDDIDIYVGALAFPGAVDAEERFYINDGAGFFSDDGMSRFPSEFISDLTNNHYAGSALFDVDRDGDPDLVLSGTPPPERDPLLLNDGTGHFTLAPLEAMPPDLNGEARQGTDLTPFDFDGDGWLDLLMISINTAPEPDIASWRLLLNNQDGTFRDGSDRLPLDVDTLPALSFHEADSHSLFADFNDDGLVDLILQNPGHIFLNQGGGNFLDVSELLPGTAGIFPFPFATGQPPKGFLVPGDVDNDGDVDFLYVFQLGFYVIRNVKRITTFPIPGPPVNDTSDTPGVITASPFDGTVDTSGAATDSSDPIPSCGGGAQNKSVWYQFTSPDNGTITADTFGSSYDTVLSAWTGAPGGFTQIACNDDATPPASLEAPARAQTTATDQSQVTFAATAGVTYAFMISAKNDDGGSLAFNLSFQASAVLPTATALQTVIPHSAEGGGFLSRLFVTNLTNATNNVLINRVNQSGAVVESSTLALQPAATTQFSAGEEARTEALDVAWFTVGSDGSVAASVLFEFDSESLNLPENFRTAVGALASEPLTAFTAPVRVATVDVTVGLALADLSGSSNTVNLALMDQDGLIVAQDSLTLSAYQQTAFSLQDRTAFRDIILGVPEFIGSLAVTTADANKPVAAIVVGNNLGQLFALPVIPGTASSSGSNLTAPTAVTRVPFPGSAQAIPSGNFTTIIPHSAAGGGFLSRLFIVNLSSNSNSITVNRVGQDGTVLETTNATLQAAATLVIADPEEVRNQDLAVQWFAIGSEMPIGASLLFEFDSESLGLEENFQTAVGSLAAEPLSSFTTPIRVATVDVTAGIALANVNDASTTVNLRLIDENGTTVAQDSISLGASQQTAFSLQDRAAFRDIILGVPEFIGALAVTTSNPNLPVAALVIGNNLGQLFALPVTPGTAP